MKRTTIYWILFFVFLIVLSWLYSSLHDYKEPILHKTRSNLYEPAQVGDLYLIKDQHGSIDRFFKVIETTKYGRAVHIAEGNPTYKNNFHNEQWIRKGIRRPIYFESSLKKVDDDYLVNLEEGSNDFNIYRLIYPPEEIPIAFKIFHSPLFIIIGLGIIFLLIWLFENINVYLNYRYKWITQGITFLLFSTLTASVLSLLQLQVSYAQEPNSVMVLTINNSLSMVFTCAAIALISLPFFFLFKFTKAKYISVYRFADQEFLKFLFILMGGLTYILAICITFFVFMCFFDPSISNPIIKPFFQWDFIQMIGLEGILSCGIIASANFLNNLRKHIQQLKFKEKLLIKSNQTVLSAQSALDTLQARVNPHFLYNSLNSIASLAQINPVKTEEMALALSDFYKHSTNRQEEHISTLALELKQLKSYLGIEKIRFGDRLQYDFDIDKKVLKTEIPRFLLQPLVENAIKYGYNKKEDRISINIQAEQIKHQLHLRIIDSGEPFSGEMNTGYGLRSIKKKLKLLYPNAHELHFLNKPTKQVHIILDIAKNQLYA